MHKYTVLFFALWALAPACRAVETKTWTENDQSDFEKGTLTKLSLRNDGRLTLAPVFKEIVDTSMPYLWALARDSKGNLYAGGGGPGGTQAKLFVIDAAGKSRVLAELPGMEIHAIAVNSHGQVFAATAPDGKVYRIGSDGKPDVFYDPHAKYIWAMAFNSTGDLFVATGDEGEIHKVAADGKGAVFFRTEETHARSMAIDGQDNLIVGTEPSGLIVRVSTKGEGFVLYQAAKREVTAVAVAPDGSIYAAGVGNKTPGAPAPAPAPALPVPPANISAGPRGNAGAPTSPATPAAIAGGSEVYRIEKDGAPRKVWSQAQDLVYAISFDGEGRPVIGTGNKGKIYRIDSPLISTLLINTLPTQVTNLLAAPGGKIYATTGNVGRLYQVGPELEKQGTYESSAFDAGFFSYWGRLSYLGSDGNGRVTFETRSGNLDRPQKNWSSWSKVDTAGASRIGSPSAQFVQYRATIATTGTSGKAAAPEILEVDIAYQQKNVAPVIEEIEITPSNYKFPAPVSLTTASQNLTLPPLGQHRKSPGSGLDALSSQAMTYAKGYAGARWAAIDPNGDELVYTVEIRGVKESAWKVLREKVKERYVSWDSTAFPDGEYLLRVTASDAPANPAGTELKNQLESDRVVIDNTPPQISGLAGSRSGKKITVNWKAKDALSEIHKAEYSLDGKDWTLLEPTTRLSDSLEHEYLLNIDDVSSGEHTVAVRVADEYDNQAVDKIVVR